MTPAEDVKAAKHYRTFGPFSFDWDHTSNSEAFKAALKRFWAERKRDCPAGICDAVGVYVWAFNDGENLLPWNVGKTDRQGFKGRFPQKESTFLQFTRRQELQSMSVFLLALMTPKGKFRKATGSGTIATNSWLEDLLIGSALAVNPALRNSSSTSKYKRLKVDGYLNDDAASRTQEAKSFAQVFRA